MTDKKKHVIIYLPTGRIDQWTTSAAVHEGDTTVRLAATIESEPDRVSIGYKVDDKVEAKAYVRMPYELEMF